MIFVTLGTQDKSFVRLLDQLEKLIQSGIINDEVIVQAGSTKYNSSNMIIVDYIDMNEFNNYIHNSNLVISHGGIGSILAALDNDKKVIAVARLKKYKEHENDHQLEIIRNFSKTGFILGCEDVSELENKFQELDCFTPKKYVSNNANFCNTIIRLIEKEEEK